MRAISKTFYNFTGLHALLIGLFPFFIPVFLWKQGFSLTDISYFIALTGLSFCVTLWVTERGILQNRIKLLVMVSFVAEVSLLGAVFMTKNTLFLPVFGILNGMYNCLFWIIQRLLFFETAAPDNTGEKFGNFQIFVLIVLKIGILTGGILLEKGGLVIVFILSFLIAALGIWVFRSLQEMVLSGLATMDVPLGLRDLLTFDDRSHSKPVFVVDGIFLFLESYFWTISLFLFVQESFWRLGLLVIILAVVFSLSFLLIKNTIDRLPRQRVYCVAVILYGGSWLLRGLVDEGFSQPLLLVSLALITFCTSFFRLAFNKRFFDLARNTTAHRYIFIKSYYSQFFIALFFVTFGYVVSLFAAPEQVLRYTYCIASAGALLYIIYALDTKEPPT
jgi:hypothetical protein